MHTATQTQLQQLIQEGVPKDVLLLDVRSAEEHHLEHIPGSVNIPQEVIHDQKDFLDRYTTIYVYCNSGRRSADTCPAIGTLGLTATIINIPGGILQWKQWGLPTIKAKGRMPIIQQVHSIAGSLILAGTLLALLIDPLWIMLSGLVGAGLLFAGLTGFCGMAAVLARMPWNKM